MAPTAIANQTSSGGDPSSAASPRRMEATPPIIGWRTCRYGPRTTSRDVGSQGASVPRPPSRTATPSRRRARGPRRSATRRAAPAGREPVREPPPDAHGASPPDEERRDDERDDDRQQEDRAHVAPRRHASMMRREPEPVASLRMCGRSRSPRRGGSRSRLRATRALAARHDAGGGGDDPRALVRPARLDHGGRAEPPHRPRLARRRVPARDGVAPACERARLRVLGARGVPPPGRGLAALPRDDEAAPSVARRRARQEPGARRGGARRDPRARAARVARLRR